MSLVQMFTSRDSLGLAFVIGLVLFSTITAVLHLWERRKWTKTEDAFVRELHAMRDSFGKEQETGFAFFEIEDEYKPLFQDAMNGFQEFARLKGYKITLATNVTIPRKIGIKILGDYPFQTGNARIAIARLPSSIYVLDFIANDY